MKRNQLPMQSVAKNFLAIALVGSTAAACFDPVARGPKSPSGFTVRVTTHDTSIGTGDWHTYISIYDTAGDLIQACPGPSAGTRSGFDKMVASMRWTGPNVLLVTTDSETREITVNQGIK